MKIYIITVEENYGQLVETRPYLDLETAKRILGELEEQYADGGFTITFETKEVS